MFYNEKFLLRSERSEQQHTRSLRSNIHARYAATYTLATQQHNQDLKRINDKREYEFSNSSLFTRMHYI